MTVTRTSNVFDNIDVNGGAIDNTTIGAGTVSTGAFSTLSATGNITYNGAVNGGHSLTDGTTTAINYISSTLTNSYAIGTTSNHPLIFGINNTFPMVTLNTDGRLNLTNAFSSTPDAITATSEGVAASLTTLVTEITTNGDSDLDNVTLANGAAGQIKKFAVKAVGNAADSVKITPATMVGGTQITFAANPLGLGCEMVYTTAGWVVTGNNGGTIS